MPNFKLILGYYLLFGAFLDGVISNESNDFHAEINSAIDRYMNCINKGKDLYRAGERFKTFVDSKRSKTYTFIESTKTMAALPEKKGKSTVITTEIKDDSNPQPNDMTYRFLERVEKKKTKNTSGTTTNSGSGSLEVGVDAWVVSVSVKTTVEGKQVDTVNTESENTTIQTWDRFEAIPAHTRSITKIERLNEMVRIPSTVQRLVKGYLPIYVNKKGRKLTDEKVWKPCSSVSKPIKISKKTYLVSYDNFGDVDIWKPRSDGALVYEYEGIPTYNSRLCMSHTRSILSLKGEINQEHFCRLMGPDVEPVVPDADEAEIEIDEGDSSGKVTDNTRSFKLQGDLTISNKKDDEEKEKDDTPKCTNSRSCGNSQTNKRKPK